MTKPDADFTPRLSALVKAASLFALLITAGQASAQTITVDSTTAVDSSWTFNYSLDVSSDTGNATLTATTTFTLISFANDKVVIQIDVANTTNPPNENDVIRLTAFGFDTDPDLVVPFASLEQPGILFDTILVDYGQGNPNGALHVELCAAADSPCSSGEEGLAPGEADMLELALYGSFSSGLELTGLPVRFTGDYGSYVFGPGSPPNDPPNDPPPPPVVVPEPSVLGLIGLGLVSLGWRVGRKRTG